MKFCCEKFVATLKYDKEEGRYPILIYPCNKSTNSKIAKRGQTMGVFDYSVRVVCQLKFHLT